MYVVVLFLPSVLVLIGVLGYPAGRTIWISLHFLRLDEPWLGEPFVGLKNYTDLAKDPLFTKSISVTFLYTLLVVPFGTTVALLIAKLTAVPLRLKL